MGAERFFNGYYRVLLSCDSDVSNRLIESMIIGVVPDSGYELKKEVSLEKPGMLDKLLTSEEKENITHLVVKGKLNGEDIKIIRQMAGAIGAINSDTTIVTGVLRYLDLSMARFITDENHAYLRKDGSGYTYTQTSYAGLFNHENKSVNLNNATIDDLKEIQRRGLLKGSDYIFGGGVNSNIYVDFSLKKGIVTPFLFEGCDNLQTILIPEDTKEIKDGAFAYCNSLVDIILPPKVQTISEGSFMYCYNLEHVYYMSSSIPMEKKGVHCSFNNLQEDFKKWICTGAFAGNNSSTCRGLIRLKME